MKKIEKKVGSVKNIKKDKLYNKKEKQNKDIHLNVVGVPKSSVNVSKTSTGSRGQNDENYQLYKISIDTKPKPKRSAISQNPLPQIQRHNPTTYRNNDKSQTSPSTNMTLSLTPRKSSLKTDSDICFTVHDQKRRNIKLVGNLPTKESSGSDTFETQSISSFNNQQTSEDRRIPPKGVIFSNRDAVFGTSPEDSDDDLPYNKQSPQIYQMKPTSKPQNIFKSPDGKNNLLSVGPDSPQERPGQIVQPLDVTKSRNYSKETSSLDDWSYPRGELATTQDLQKSPPSSYTKTPLTDRNIVKEIPENSEQQSQPTDTNIMTEKPISYIKNPLFTEKDIITKSPTSSIKKPLLIDRDIMTDSPESFSKRKLSKVDSHASKRSSSKSKKPSKEGSKKISVDKDITILSTHQGPSPTSSKDLKNPLLEINKLPISPKHQDVFTSFSNKIIIKPFDLDRNDIVETENVPLTTSDMKPMTPATSGLAQPLHIDKINYLHPSQVKTQPQSSSFNHQGRPSLHKNSTNVPATATALLSPSLEKTNPLEPLTGLKMSKESFRDRKSESSGVQGVMGTDSVSTKTSIDGFVTPARRISTQPLHIAPPRHVATSKLPSSASDQEDPSARSSLKRENINKLDVSSTGLPHIPSYDQTSRKIPETDKFEAVKPRGKMAPSFYDNLNRLMKTLEPKKETSPDIYKDDTQVPRYLDSKGSKESGRSVLSDEGRPINKFKDLVTDQEDVRARRLHGEGVTQTDVSSTGLRHLPSYDQTSRKIPVDNAFDAIGMDKTQGKTSPNVYEKSSHFMNMPDPKKETSSDKYDDNYQTSKYLDSKGSKESGRSDNNEINKVKSPMDSTLIVEPMKEEAVLSDKEQLINKFRDASDQEGVRFNPSLHGECIAKPYISSSGLQNLPSYDKTSRNIPVVDTFEAAGEDKIREEKSPSLYEKTSNLMNTLDSKKELPSDKYNDDSLASRNLDSKGSQDSGRSFNIDISKVKSPIKSTSPVEPIKEEAVLTEEERPINKFKNASDQEDVRSRPPLHGKHIQKSGVSSTGLRHDQASRKMPVDETFEAVRVDKTRGKMSPSFYEILSNLMNTLEPKKEHSSDKCMDDSQVPRYLDSKEQKENGRYNDPRKITSKVDSNKGKEPDKEVSSNILKDEENDFKRRKINEGVESLRPNYLNDAGFVSGKGGPLNNEDTLAYSEHVREGTPFGHIQTRVSSFDRKRQSKISTTKPNRHQYVNGRLEKSSISKKGYQHNLEKGATNVPVTDEVQLEGYDPRLMLKKRYSNKSNKNEDSDNYSPKHMKKKVRRSTITREVGHNKHSRRGSSADQKQTSHHPKDMFSPREELIYVGRLPETTYNVFFAPDADNKKHTSDNNAERKDDKYLARGNKKPSSRKESMKSDGPSKDNNIANSKKESNGMKKDNKGSMSEKKGKNKKDKPFSPVKSKILLNEGPKGILIFVNKKIDSKSNIFEKRSSPKNVQNRQSVVRGSGENEELIERSPSGTKITHTYPCGCIRITTKDPGNDEVTQDEFITALCTKGSKCHVVHPELQTADIFIPLHTDTPSPVVRSKMSRRPVARSIASRSPVSRSTVSPRSIGGRPRPFPEVEVVADGIISKRPIPPKTPAPTMKGANFTGTIVIKSNKLNGVCNFYLDERLKDYLREHIYDFKPFLEDGRQKRRSW